MSQKFTKLTRINLRKLQPGQRLNEHGIIFERLADGDGRYSINIMVDGVRIHRSVGKESEGVTLTQAQELVEKLKTDARMGRLNLPKNRKTYLRFEEAANKYLAKLGEEAGKDIPRKKQRLDLYLIPFFKGKPLDKITNFDVERYKKVRIDAKASNGTINRELSTLSHLLNKAMEWGWIHHRPCQIRRLKENRGRIEWLTKEEVQKLLKAAKVDDFPYVYPFIVIALETAMRRMEILSIEIENINFEKRTIYIPKAKAGAREAYISENLEKFLKNYIEQTVKPGQKWLFPTANQKLSSTGHLMNIERPFRRVVKTAGLDAAKVVRHTLRHTAISHLVQAGIDLPTVKRISGHKTLQMVERYSHQNQEHIQFALKRLDDRYPIFDESSSPDYTKITQNKKNKPSKKQRKPLSKKSGPSRIRTYNQAIMSRLLHH